MIILVPKIPFVWQKRAGILQKCISNSSKLYNNCIPPRSIWIRHRFLTWFRRVRAIKLRVSTFSVPCCDVSYDFLVKRCSIRFESSLFCKGFMFIYVICIYLYYSYLFMVFVFIYIICIYLFMLFVFIYVISFYLYYLYLFILFVFIYLYLFMLFVFIYIICIYLCYLYLFILFVFIYVC